MNTFLKFIDNIRADKWWGRYFVIFAMATILIDLLTGIAAVFFA